MKAKRIIAWVGIVFLVGMYIVTLITGMMHGEKADIWFKMSIACTIALPVLLYGYNLIIRIVRKEREKNEFTDHVEK